MIDHEAAHHALRNRARTLIVTTTGEIALAQTDTGFTRTAGSFVDDGFVVGMEVTPSAFAVNGVGVIDAVAATTLSVSGTRIAEPAANGRALTVGLPSLRAFENMPFTKIPGRPYIVEEYSPSTSRMVTSPVRIGRVEETGDYFLTWYGVSGVGTTALRRGVDALKALFASGTDLPAGAHVVTVRPDPGPQTGQIIALADYAALQLRIPWWARSRNAIAA